MRFQEWLSQNWFSVLQSIGIIGSLLFTGLASRADARERRTSTELSIVQAHRELWGKLYKHPELSRVLDQAADLVTTPVTPKEEMFILQLLVHLNTALQVLRKGSHQEPDEALRKDVQWFFSLPIPSAVWDEAKARQDTHLVHFVESCRGHVSAGG